MTLYYLGKPEITEKENYLICRGILTKTYKQYGVNTGIHKVDFYVDSKLPKYGDGEGCKKPSQHNVVLDETFKDFYKDIKNKDKKVYAYFYQYEGGGRWKEF